MKKYRRIEITAFRRRITFTSGESKTTDEDLCINDVDSKELIEIESTEGQQILLETMHLLERKIADEKQKDL